MDTGDTNDSRSSNLGSMRLLVGFVQGWMAMLLINAGQEHLWPATDQLLYTSLAAFTALVPPTILTGLGQMRMAVLGLWTIGSTAGVLYAVRHGFLRTEAMTLGEDSSVLALLFPAMFIGYHLLAAADQDRRPIARYRAYFDIAWKNGVQLALSLMFLGAFWLLLYLGAALFSLIKIDAVLELIQRDWFIYPMSAIVFAMAVHVSDMRVGLIAGARTLALMLLSWLLPVMAFFAVAFLGTLPVAGIELLWDTGRATGLLLTAAVVLVILINAAYQQGGEDVQPPAILRFAAQIAGLALLAIVAIAAYSIWLRIDQHGLTPDRVLGVAFVAVASCYTAGYAVAAVWPGKWMRPLEATNIAAAFVMVGVIVALLTPLGDPARLAVQDQVRRLQTGIVSVEKFDFNFLRFRSARYGIEALKRLAADKSSPKAQAIAAKAWEALGRKTQNPVKPVLSTREQLAQITVYPKGAQLPESFLAQEWADAPNSPHLCPGFAADENRCEAFLADFDGDGLLEVMTGNRNHINVWRLSSERVWISIGGIEPSRCFNRAGWSMLDGLRAGTNL